MLLPILLMFFGIIFISLGLVHIKKPEIIHEFTESWKNNDTTEPSDAYSTIVKIKGIVLVVIGILFFICGVITLFWLPPFLQ